MIIRGTYHRKNKTYKRVCVRCGNTFETGGKTSTICPCYNKGHGNSYVPIHIREEHKDSGLSEAVVQKNIALLEEGGELTEPMVLLKLDKKFMKVFDNITNEIRQDSYKEKRIIYYSDPAIKKRHRKYMRRRYKEQRSFETKLMRAIKRGDFTPKNGNKE